MKNLLLLSTLLTGISLLISLINYFTMRVVRSSDAIISESVSILIPMRNEEVNVEPLIQSLLATQNLNNFEITVLNDHSEDQTYDHLQKFAANISILNGRELPEGWMGKPFACLQLAEKSLSEYLVFMDADVRPSPAAVSSAIGVMRTLNWDFISPYPAQTARTKVMKLIQPLLQWSWFSSVPLRIAESGRQSSMVIANGQFFIVKRKAYESIKGHESVKAEVLEDLCLARALASAGFKGGVADGSTVVTCSMYERNTDLITGYTKSLWKAFGGAIGTIFAILLLTLTQIVPLLLLVTGERWAIIPFACAGLTHVFASMKTGSRPVNALTHPVAIALLILLICESYRRKLVGRLEWRGRRVL